MQFWQFIFGISCFLVFYNYAGYAIIVFLVNKLTGRNKQNIFDPDFLPTVSFIVAAYNEEDFIENKIKNSFELDYPEGKIEFIIVTDGSTDKTADIVLKYPKILLLHSHKRKGKVAAMNRAINSSTNEILIFSDANTLLNKDAIKHISRHYFYKNTGGVAGEKKVITSFDNSNKVGAGEGLYWKYESFLKNIDSKFYSVVGAAGELFSVRKELYNPAPPNVILDDFVISLEVARKGYRIIYEPEAYAMESPSFSLNDEKKRKIRIAAGGFQAMVMLRSLFLFWKHPALSFLYISHRVLRWAVSPFCMLLAFVSNMILLLEHDISFFAVLFFIQVIFYAIAIVGSFISSSGNLLMKICRLCWYFVFMNISVILGFIRFIRGNQTALWEKAKRAQ